ncbi:hypothetical protein cypCar_00028462 [Cyprinus carpio]|nr:hypothetical protein cypCar_00028462 [Cyprinus carpio]
MDKAHRVYSWIWQYPSLPEPALGNVRGDGLEHPGYC